MWALGIGHWALGVGHMGIRERWFVLLNTKERLFA